ncbi:MAG: winged helix-turn-helix domain-containing protein, partial [Bryobacteraceae bacterium]
MELNRYYRSQHQRAARSFSRSVVPEVSRVPAGVRFGAYELDVSGMELRKNGVRIRLQEQPFLVLCALVAKPGDVVTREELKDEVWASDTLVDFDQSLNKAINRLREALNDDASQPRYIETVPRRGYRFVAHVEDI